MCSQPDYVSSCFAGTGTLDLLHGGIHLSTGLHGPSIFLSSHLFLSPPLIVCTGMCACVCVCVLYLYLLHIGLPCGEDWDKEMVAGMKSLQGKVDLGVRVRPRIGVGLR